MAHFSFDRDQNQVMIEADSCGRKMTLNRPRQLNCLTYEMISQMEQALKMFEKDSDVKLVILKGNGKAFCAGGDVIRYVNFMTTGHWTFGAILYKKQLTVDYLIATYKKPLVSFVNGIVMGGGAGLSMNGKFRVVTENTVFAMPEASLGHFPDVGASYFLSRLPGHFGEYLALTGARIGGTEMLACGLATHYVLSKDLQLLENALCEVNSSDNATISILIDKFTHKADLKQDSFHKRLEIINRCFSKMTVEEILLLLENEIANGADKWVVKALSSIKSASPTSLKISLRSIREGRNQELKDCLIREYATVGHIIRRTVNNDFYEGARALLIDKDKKPKWKPSELKEVSDEMVNQFFTQHDDDEWVPIKLPDRLINHNNIAKSKL